MSWSWVIRSMRSHAPYARASRVPFAVSSRCGITTDKAAAKHSAATKDKAGNTASFETQHPVEAATAPALVTVVPFCRAGSGDARGGGPPRRQRKDRLCVEDKS